MPIVIPRTGPVPAPEISQNDRNKLWERIIQNYAEAHPELFSAAMDQDEKQKLEE